jgi:hypothetical protein
MAQVRLTSGHASATLDNGTVLTRPWQTGTSALGAGDQALVDSGVIYLLGLPAQSPPSLTTGLTDAQLRASPVPVSGSLAGGLTDTELRASAVPVSTASLPLPTGAATEATLAADLGALTETAPGTDTASAGLNGRLQRVAQRLTSLIALLPASLGQKTKANSFAVTVASDQDALAVTDGGGSLTVDGTVTATGPLTDTQLRATAVPVSNASLPLPNGATTEATLAALSAKAAGDTTNGLRTQPRADAVTTGNITASGQSITATMVSGMGGVAVWVQGTYAGVTLNFEASTDGGTIFVPLLLARPGSFNATLAPALGTNGSEVFVGSLPPGATHVRARSSAYTSGTANITIASNAAARDGLVTSVAISSIVPGGSATTLGKVEDAAAASGDTGVFGLGVRNDALATPTSTDGDYSQFSVDARGAQFVNPAAFTYSNISTAATTTVKSGAGFLHAISLNSKGTVASTITVYDNTTGSGTKIGTIDSLNPLSSIFILDIAFATGLTIVTTGTVAPDLTVSYR